jgi:hypothetical protein
MKASMKLEPKRLTTAVKDAKFRGVQNALAFIYTVMRRSVKRRKGPSKPGSTLHTQTGALKNAFALDFDNQEKDAGVVGAKASIAGPILGAHEIGGKFRGQVYPARPTSGPALQKALPRIPEGFKLRS